MRKIATNQTSGTWRWMAALAVMLAAFGCTSNRYPGAGEPTVVTPQSNGAVAPAQTPGSSYGTAGIPPMASSYTITTPRVNTDALAILAADQGFQGRVLGPSGAEGPQLGPGTTPTGGQFVNPAEIVNPQVTVNATLTSPGVPAITGGGTGGGTGAALFVAPSTIGTTATTAAGTAGVAGTASVPAASATAAAATAPPATAAVTLARPAVPANIGGALGAVGTAPVATATNVPATASAASALNQPMASATTATVTTPTVSAVTLRSAQRAATTTASVSTSSRLVLNNNPVRVVTGANGELLITNVKK